MAKNYLNKKEIDELNRIVTMYLDYAENQAARQIPMTMKDWVEKLECVFQKSYGRCEQFARIPEGIRTG